VNTFNHIYTFTSTSFFFAKRSLSHYFSPPTKTYCWKQWQFVINISIKLLRIPDSIDCFFLLRNEAVRDASSNFCTMFMQSNIKPVLAYNLHVNDTKLSYFLWYQFNQIVLMAWILILKKSKEEILIEFKKTVICIVCACMNLNCLRELVLQTNGVKTKGICKGDVGWSWR